MQEPIEGNLHRENCQPSRAVNPLFWKHVDPSLCRGTDESRALHEYSAITAYSQPNLTRLAWLFCQALHEVLA